MSQSKFVAAIELGTSRVKALVGELVDGRSLNILGKGEHETSGVKKGVILNPTGACESVVRALEEAEYTAGAKVDSIYLAQSGGHVKGDIFRGTAVVGSADGRVSMADVERACSEVQRQELPPGRTNIHYIRNHFLLDQREVRDPAGQAGRLLESRFLVVHGDQEIIKENLRLINGIGLKVSEVVLSSIASAYVLLQDSEKDVGSIVIDIGAGTTDFAVYRGGCIVRVGSIPIGGDHITNDLSLGLRLSRKNSEKLKTHFAKAVIDQEDKNERVWLRGDLTIGDRDVLRHALYRIVNARVEEIFQIVYHHCQDLIDEDMMQAGIFLTGGTARLPRITEVCSKVFELPTRIGKPQGWVKGDLCETEWSTPVGVLYFALSHENDQPHRPASRGIFNKVRSILKKSSV
jgi:cell division protein FtsA